jgi:phage baseplate assembly protein W
MPEISTSFSTPRVYKDISLTFARNVVTSDVVTVSDADAIKRSLKLLLLSRTGETPFFPEFGSRIYTMLFEPLDPITTLLLQHEIEAAVAAYEPRVRILQLSVVPSLDEQGYDVNFYFTIVNQVAPITLTLYLSRLR